MALHLLRAPRTDWLHPEFQTILFEAPHDLADALERRGSPGRARITQLPLPIVVAPPRTLADLLPDRFVSYESEVGRSTAGTAT